MGQHSRVLRGQGDERWEKEPERRPLNTITKGTRNAFLHVWASTHRHHSMEHVSQSTHKAIPVYKRIYCLPWHLFNVCNHEVCVYAYL